MEAIWVATLVRGLRDGCRVNNRRDCRALARTNEGFRRKILVAQDKILLPARMMRLGQSFLESIRISQLHISKRDDIFGHRIAWSLAVDCTTGSDNGQTCKDENDVVCFHKPVLGPIASSCQARFSLGDAKA